MISRSFFTGAICAFLLTGCSTVGDLFDRRQNATNQELSVEPSLLSIYLADVETLMSGDNAARNRAWRRVDLDYQAAPTTRNQLRYALALATPGHSGTDLARADGMLTELLQTPELLLAEESMLATVHLGLLRSRVTAESNARQANNSESQTHARELAEARAQLAQLALLRQDNERLRAALAETEEKLRAITNIERSIRERDDESNGYRNSTEGTGRD